MVEDGTYSWGVAMELGGGGGGHFMIHLKVMKW